MLAPFQFQFTFHCGGELRKGLAVHAGIIDGIVEGMNVKPEDRVLFVDIIPNRRGSSLNGDGWRAFFPVCHHHSFTLCIEMDCAFICCLYTWL